MAKYRSWSNFINDFAYFEDGKYWYSMDGKLFKNAPEQFNWDSAERMVMHDCDGKEMYINDQVEMVGDEYYDDYLKYRGWIVTERMDYYIDLMPPDNEHDGIPYFSFEYRAHARVIGNIHQGIKE